MTPWLCGRFVLIFFLEKHILCGSIVQQLIIFDLDKTLTSENVSYLFGKYLYSKKMYSFPILILLLLAYALHAVYLISSNLLHRISFYLLFYKKNADQFQKLANEFLEENLPAFLRCDMQNELHMQQKKNELIYIMSTSPSFLVRPIAKILHVDNVLATEYEVDANGQYSKIALIVDGNEKKEKLLQISKKISPSPEITVYSDSMRDFPIFKICQNPVAVYPEKSLRRFAKNNDWRIIG